MASEENQIAQQFQNSLALAGEQMKSYTIALTRIESQTSSFHQNITNVNKGFDKLAIAAISLGALFKGLQGTREGYQLSYAIQHVFFEIADSLRYPIRIITREIEGFAHSMSAANQLFTQPVETKFGAVQDKLEKWSGDFFDWFNGNKGRSTIDANTQKERHGRESNDHLSPMLTTSFGAVEELQRTMQKLSTENPAMDKGISLMEIVVKLLAKIAGFSDKEISNAFGDKPLTVRPG